VTAVTLVTLVVLSPGDGAQMVVMASERSPLHRTMMGASKANLVQAILPIARSYPNGDTKLKDCFIAAPDINADTPVFASSWRQVVSPRPEGFLLNGA
jgi:hypothetical protein